MADLDEMANSKSGISPKRYPAPTPKSVVENGDVHYGTFSESFKKLNMLETYKPCGPRMPDFLKSSRLTEWEAFEVAMDSGILISAVYNVGPLGFSIFVWYDKEEDKIYSWRNLVPKNKAHVASQLIDDNCYCRTKYSEFTIYNDFENGRAEARGYSKGKAGEFSINISLDRISEPSNCVMPLAKNKDQSFRNPLYSEKDFFKATGHIALNGKVYTTNERSVGIIDDHKGFYPYKAHYDWLTAMGKLNIDGKPEFFAFNLTRNQSVDQYNYNENLIWLKDETFPLPPVVFKHKNNKKKAREWHIVDEGGKGLVDITFKINQVFYMPIHTLIWECYYALPFGTITGHLTDTNGKRYILDNMSAVGEDKTTRM